MDQWEAKYKALASGFADPKLVATAELVVRASIEISQDTGQPLAEVVEGMLHTLAKLRAEFPITQSNDEAPHSK
jgi:hypothetical protein